jgi:hypothetical protein
MSAPGTIAVEATDAKYAGLKHVPSGQPLGKDGKAVWPADQFTFRLIGEAALRECDVEPVADAPAASALPPESIKS